MNTIENFYNQALHLYAMTVMGKPVKGISPIFTQSSHASNLESFNSMPACLSSDNNEFFVSGCSPVKMTVLSVV